MKEIETDDVYFKIENDILFCSYKRKLIIDLNVAKRIVRERLDFAEGRPYPILIDFSNLKMADKAARDYMNDPEGGLKGILCGAFVSNNAVATLFINLYLKINRPTIPAKFFTSKEEALYWLSKIKTERAIL
jgi:hypothetical protein